ncbi:unnamed protein product, partial [Linum tenue]
RYWTHVVNCPSCNRAYKILKVLETVLQVLAFGLMGIAVATKQGMVSTNTRAGLVILATMSFAASRWLAHLVYSNFHYHDYNQSLRENEMIVILLRQLGLQV